MSNINIEVLENTIAAYIDSAYKEITDRKRVFGSSHNITGEYVQYMPCQ